MVWFKGLCFEGCCRFWPARLGLMLFAGAGFWQVGWDWCCLRLRCGGWLWRNLVVLPGGFRFCFGVLACGFYASVGRLWGGLVVWWLVGIWFAGVGVVHFRRDWSLVLELWVPCVLGLSAAWVWVFGGFLVNFPCG